MDVLSDAITAMRTGRPHSSRHEKHASWAMRFPSFAGAGFHVVLQGACWLFPPTGDPVPLGPGDVAFLPHGSEHLLADSPSAPPDDMPVTALDGRGCIRSDESSPQRSSIEPDRHDAVTGSTVLLCGAYELDQTRPHPLLYGLPEFVHLPARVGHHSPLRAAIDLLGGEMKEPQPGTDAVVPTLLDLLLLYILRAWYAEQANGPATHGWAAAFRDQAIMAALRGIHRDPGRQWTVQELSAEAGLSRSAFARRFSALVGQPPLSYLTWWRMTAAARLMRTSDSPLGKVAEQIGYTSEFAFAKAFKREYGTAPGKYRRQKF